MLPASVLSTGMAMAEQAGAFWETVSVLTRAEGAQMLPARVLSMGVGSAERAGIVLDTDSSLLIDTGLAHARMGEGAEIVERRLIFFSTIIEAGASALVSQDGGGKIEMGIAGPQDSQKVGRGIIDFVVARAARQILGTNSVQDGLRAVGREWNDDGTNGAASALRDSGAGTSNGIREGIKTAAEELSRDMGTTKENSRDGVNGVAEVLRPALGPSARFFSIADERENKSKAPVLSGKRPKPLTKFAVLDRRSSCIDEGDVRIDVGRLAVLGHVVDPVRLGVFS